MKIETQKSRIEIIDVLRGFALLGIIIVHFSDQYYAGGVPASIPNLFTKNLGDEIISGVIDVLIVGKFYLIFSFLFGLSFFIQLSKSDGSLSFVVRFAWRLVVLFAIGFIHSLHYRGDILTIFAVLGFGLLLVHRLPDKAILVLAVLLILNVPALVTRVVEGFMSDANPFPPQDEKVLEAYHQAVKSGSYGSILKANYYELFEKARFQLISGRAYITLGLFLLGLYVGKRDLVASWESRLPAIRALRRKALWTLLFSVLATAGIFGLLMLLGIKLNDTFNWTIGGFAYDLANACLATFYVSTILILFTKERWRNQLMHLYAVGRMGLTTYLTQSLFGTVLFFSFGLGLLGEMGSLACTLIALVIYILQIELSKRWLAHFRYGPVEWFWRSLTYLKVQPLSK